MAITGIIYLRDNRLTFINGRLEDNISLSARRFCPHFYAATIFFTRFCFNILFSTNFIFLSVSIITNGFSFSRVRNSVSVLEILVTAAN